MDIVFLAHFAGSPRHGMVYGHYYLAREWVRLGHRVTIVAAGYAHTRTEQPQCTGRITEEFIDGVRYLWVRTPRYDASGQAGRVASMLSFTAQAFFLGRFVKEADLVICSSHYPFAIYPAQRLAYRLNAKLIFEVRDLWPLTLIELGGASPGHPFIRAMQRSEDFAYRNAEKIVSVLPGAERYMLERGMRPGRFMYIPNGIDLDDNGSESLPDEHEGVLQELRRNHRFLVGYAGRIGLANALHALIDSVEKCDDDVHAVILGDGGYLPELRVRVNSLGIAGRVTFLPPVRRSQVRSFLGYLDAAYIGLQSQPLFRFGVSPTKLNDYMLAGKPVIYAIDAPGNAVSESGAGISCRPEDSESISRAIMKLRGLSLDARDRMGHRGSQWIIANRDYKVLAERFLVGVFSDLADCERGSRGKVAVGD